LGGSALIAWTGQRHQSPSRQGDGEGLPARWRLLPLVKIIDRDKVATPQERLAEGRLSASSIGRLSSPRVR
jgi:hypothetical protein